MLADTKYVPTRLMGTPQLLQGGPKLAITPHEPEIADLEMTVSPNL
jgi:hypothetical protein